jgi:hypothetical protein
MHRVIKTRWHRARNCDPIGQMVNIGILVETLTSQAAVLRGLGKDIPEPKRRVQVQNMPPPEFVDMKKHHEVSRDKHQPVYVPHFVRDNSADVAFRVSFVSSGRPWFLRDLFCQFFWNKLREFVFRTLAPNDSRDEIPLLELLKVRIDKSALYSVATFAVHYTTYDGLRGRDVVNPNYDRRFVMVQHALEDGAASSHPWRYARVLKVFHADVALSSSLPLQHIEFLWVRWFQTDQTHHFGAGALRLERVHYLPEVDTDATAFVLISRVIRAIQMCPATRYKVDVRRPYGRSMAHDTSEGDYHYHYVGRCVPSLLTTPSVTNVPQVL